MSLIEVEIDGRKIEAGENITILEAASGMDIHIPNLCYMKDREAFTSCMVCLVEEIGAGKLIPACSTKVFPGMNVKTDSPRVREARRDTLGLLLDEHYGDCNAPCQRGCPAHMDIPLMIRQIKNLHMKKAFYTVLEHIPLASSLGRICPAPCEKSCYRGKADEAVSICMLKRYAGDYGFTRGLPIEKKEPTGKKTAVIGAGPAGLSAAFYLLKEGHTCTIFDENVQPGGTLINNKLRKKLPVNIVLRETAYIKTMGADFRMKSRAGVNIDLDKIISSFDAVILASGSGQSNKDLFKGITFSKRGIEVNKENLMTNRTGVFACGGAVRTLKMAVMAVAEGRKAAYAVHAFLTGSQFNYGQNLKFSLTGPLSFPEILALKKSSSPGSRSALDPSDQVGPTNKQAVLEAGRCMHCDCGKLQSCLLRRYGIRYHATQGRSEIREDKQIIRHTSFPGVLFEPGKCIKCGKCIRITEDNNEEIGLCFTGRGFSTDVSVPFREKLSKALEKSVKPCVQNCPTGALSYLDEKRGANFE